MKKNLFLRRTGSLAVSAVLLTGLLTGFHSGNPGMLTVDAQAYTITAGHYYRVDATSLNIRSGPGFNYARQGSLPDGALVEILETRGDWGRITQGWVNLDYLRPTNQITEADPVSVGYVNTPTLNVRSGPGTQYAICGQVTEGYKLTILDTKNGWGRLDDGWVSLKYVNRASSPSGTPAPGYQDIRVNDSVKVVTDILNVRQGPGTNYDKIGYLANGEVVTVREIRGGWGRTNGGWISLSYVRSTDRQSDPGYLSSGGRVEVTADSLNVRSGSSTAHAICGSMTRGYQATVLEVKDGWGRLNDGWIDLTYVRWIR